MPMDSIQRTTTTNTRPLKRVQQRKVAGDTFKQVMHNSKQDTAEEHARRSAEDQAETATQTNMPQDTGTDARESDNHERHNHEGHIDERI